MGQHQGRTSTAFGGGDSASAVEPSAPPKYEALPPSYTTAMLYAPVKNEPLEAGPNQQLFSTQDRSNAAPPPYTQNS